MSKSKPNFGTTIALILLLTAILLLPCLPAINAAVTGVTMNSIAYLSVSPYPVVGIGQTLLVNAWIVPSTSKPPNSQLGYLGNYTITFTKPDGTKFDWKSEGISFPDATMWFTIVPDQIGNWSAVFYFSGANVMGNIWPPATSPVTHFMVQSEPLTGYPWPLSALPTDYWQYPINSENREWYSIAGDWSVASYNASKVNYNPWTKAPNTAHILWDMRTCISGVQGGYGSDPKYGQEYISTQGISYIAQGLGYMNAPDGVHCIDLATGKTLWITAGSISALMYAMSRPEAGSLEGIRPTLVPMSIGSNLVQYNALYGTITSNQTGFTSANLLIPPFAYSVINYGNASVPKYNLVCWSPGNTANTTIGMLSTGAVTLASSTLYNVSWPFTGITCIGTSASGRQVGVFQSRDANYILNGWVGGADLVTGDLLWNTSMSGRAYSTGECLAAFGKTIALNDNGYFDCFDLDTGKRIWTSDPPEYPYGFGWAYSAAAAYGNFYGFAYNGVYCYDSNTGHIKWVYNQGNSNGETPYNTWPYDHPAAIADGKLYIPMSLHTPPAPLYRGGKLSCIDAITGEEIWNISCQVPGDGGGGGTGNYPIIADGYLTQANAYDGMLYCFSKGQTTCTISAPQTGIALGQSMVITGSVLDQSPAQPGTACVSKDSMTPWMEYLHMQLPIPEGVTITGVPVSLNAVDSNGTYVHIADVTTDAKSGTFGYTWTPPGTGQYTITATFAGDNSYGSSTATTYATVQTSSSTGQAVTTEPVDLTPILYAVIGVGIAVIVAIALAIMMLRKH
ncbi:MAG TPA: PQQ-binding-like beta-propeller repeat protein [Candidatus Sulfotelmatobacter sp.]|nr:PQQ-binding-like beta-propeller repeat protein [Candidatus Sulfotelmatobacter sp.]